MGLKGLTPPSSRDTVKLLATFSSNNKTKQADGEHQTRLLSKGFVLDAAAAFDSLFHIMSSMIKEWQRSIRTLLKNLKGF